MAIDKKLQIFDDEGNPVDYDILASDVKFLPDGKDLPTKLAEMEEEIGEGGYTPPAGGIPKTDLAPAVQTSLGLADTALQAADKAQLQAAITSLQNALNALIGSGNVQGAIDTFNEVTAFLNGIDTSDPTLKNQLLALSNAITALQTALNTKANDNAVVKSISVNGGTAQTPTNGNVNIQVQTGSTISPADTAPSMDGNTALVGSSAKYAREDHVHPHDSSKLSKSDVSVETQGDGTLDINVKDDTYTINLNHVHSQYVSKKTVESNTDATVTLSADVIYDIGTVAGNKTINLPTTVDQAADYEFRLTYTSGTISGTAISGTTVANNATLSFTAGKTYQVIISGGILYFSETTVS